jgi:pimeloyl-ACP methyl ester carboxylesterase
MTTNPSTSTDGAAAATRTGTVPVEGGRLWYELGGPDRATGPDVILAHPGTMDARVWDEAFADLTRDHRVVRFDARGHGRSTSIAGDYHGHRDTLAVLDHLGLHRPVLIGNSLGGLTSLDLALEHPDRVAGCVLVGGGLSGYAFRYDALTWQRDVEAAVQVALATVQAGGDPGPAVAALVEAVLRGEVDGSHRTPDQLDPTLRSRLADLVSATLMAHHDNHGELIGAGALDRLGELAVPALVVIGSLDFRDLVEIADLIATQAPRARKVTLDGVGHMVQNERPERFHALVREFLAQVGPPVPG